jgi:hypothetical protein
MKREPRDNKGFPCKCVNCKELRQEIRETTSKAGLFSKSNPSLLGPNEDHYQSLVNNVADGKKHFNTVLYNLLKYFQLTGEPVKVLSDEEVQRHFDEFKREISLKHFPPGKVQRESYEEFIRARKLLFMREGAKRERSERQRQQQQQAEEYHTRMRALDADIREKFAELVEKIAEWRARRESQAAAETQQAIENPVIAILQDLFPSRDDIGNAEIWNDLLPFSEILQRAQLWRRPAGQKGGGGPTRQTSEASTPFSSVNRGPEHLRRGYVKNLEPRD